MSRKNIILLLCCMAGFMVVVDISIVNVALPTIQRALGMRLSTLQWIVIAYGLLLGGFLLLGGRLGDVFGRRRILLTGLSLFTLASLGAGLAHSTAVLIAARALQGFGSALIAPSALSILAATFREGKERNTVLGIYGAVGGLAASVGVIGSGILTDGPGWRWIFYINVPIGIGLIALAARILPKDIIKKGEHELDAKSAVTATSGLLLIIYGLNKTTDYGWTSAKTLGLFAAGIAVLLVFVALERRSHAPLMPFSALKNRTMIAADLTALFAFGAFFGFIFLTTLLMQQQLGYSATHTGLAWLVLTLTGFVAAGLTGAVLAIKFGPKRLILIALAAMAVASYLLLRLPVAPHFVSDMVPAFLLGGLAIGMFAPSVQISALTGVHDKTFGLASGLAETTRELGGVIVIAAISTVLVARAKTAVSVHGKAAHNLAMLNGFHAAYLVVIVAAILGFVVVLVAFNKQTVQEMSAATHSLSD